MIAFLICLFFFPNLKNANILARGKEKCRTKGSNGDRGCDGCVATPKLCVVCM